jgi:hypothetical protein
MRRMREVQDAVAYTTDQHGVIHQAGELLPVSYDVEYIRQRYDTYDRFKLRGLSYLRLGWLMAHVGRDNLSTVLDIGYGNGDFLKVCADAGLRATGYDISGYDPRDGRIALIPPRNSPQRLPDRVYDAYSVACFFDSLEHFPSLEFVLRLRARFMAISVPWCHWRACDGAFMAWKHRRPHEHLHHFSPAALARFMAAYGFVAVAQGNGEDAVRGTLEGRENILSAIFERANA